MGPEESEGTSSVFITITLLGITHTMVSTGFTGNLGPVPRGLDVGTPPLLHETSTQRHGRRLLWQEVAGEN